MSNSHGCMIDTTVVDRKRALWDYVLANDLLESKDNKVRARAWALLKDKTLFLYNFMKLNGQPVKTRWTQDVVLSDKSKRVLFCACNQHLGKSTTLDFDAATEILIDHGKRWVGLLVSNSLPQSQERMSNIKQLLDSMDHVEYSVKDVDIDTKGKSNATMLSIVIFEDVLDKKSGKMVKKTLYTNLLICCPHTSSALGYPADDVYLDEVDFWEDVKGGQIHFFNQVLDPRTYFTKGRIKGYSNPNGKERMMWFLWNQKNKAGLHHWHRYHFNYWDKESCTQDEFDNSCIGKTKNEIESTLLAAYTTTEGSFFGSEEISDMLSLELSEKGDNAGYNHETAWFLDVGSVHDQSVLIGGYVEENPLLPEIPLLKAFFIHKYPVGYPVGRVVGIDTTLDPDTKTLIPMENLEDGWQDYVEDNPSVKTVLGWYGEEYNDKLYQPLFGYDATGNSGLKPLIAAAGLDAVDVTFSGKLKWHMYQRYQYYVQQRFIKRGKERDGNTVRGCTFDYQASKLVIKKGAKTVYKQIHHENENDLDDTQDAMVGFIHLIENPDLPSLSFDIINNEGKSITNNDGSPKNDEIDEKKQASRLAGQYIPSWMNKGELNSWMDKRELV